MVSHGVSWLRKGLATCTGSCADNRRMILRQCPVRYRLIGGRTPTHGSKRLGFVPFPKGKFHAAPRRWTLCLRKLAQPSGTLDDDNLSVLLFNSGRSQRQENLLRFRLCARRGARTPELSLSLTGRRSPVCRPPNHSGRLFCFARPDVGVAPGHLLVMSTRFELSLQGAVLRQPEITAAGGCAADLRLLPA
jgi:hypothetical protein